MTSKPYKYGKHYFKYDYENGIVHMMWKPNAQELKEMREDNKEWQDKYGKDLWDLDENNMTELDSAGLRSENWKNKEIRDEYLAEWTMETDEEAACLAEDFIKNELPLYI